LAAAGRLVSDDAPAIVLDIEGTTTPIAFVYDVLFPFARRHLHAFLDDPAHADALAEPLARLRDEQAREGNRHATESIGAYVEHLMDLDRKSPGLKLLQGLIWQNGYGSGELKGELFPDVPPALRRWRAAGAMVAIYSSASELGQRLLFGHTAYGDLTPLLDGFFDTAVGAKREADSYRRIAAELGIAPARVRFVSDVAGELDAAHAAGCDVRLCVRPGNHPQPAHDYGVIHSFDEMEPLRT
jgi:enolase-phosphatase E1